ncbi:MAG TPA: TetR/AcrR family transcriptional regulator [Solirubrobacterales bacterium]|nr:TetR/AcrR family transcriptional regulator [Solirubrobacterales bacterium]
MDALVAVVAEKGFESASLEAVAERAESTLAGFHRHFGDKEDGCARAVGELCDRFDRHLLPVYLRPEPWRLRIRAAALTAAAYLSEHPEQVAFAIGEHARRGRLPQAEPSLGLHLEEIDAVRSELPEPGAPPPSAAEFCVGTFLELVIRNHRQGSIDGLEAAVPGLLYVVYDVYLGAEVAEEEMD